MNQPDFQGASRYAVEQLESYLSIIYTYHSLTHTRDEVVGMATKIADFEGIKGVDRILLLTGAYYHDIGFIHQWRNHEEIGVQFVHEVLPGYGYSHEQIDVVSGIILATRLPQTPKTRLEAIVADADLDALGRSDFWARNLALRYEMGMLGFYYSDVEWCERQAGFLQSHQYFTAAAMQLRDAQKKKNLTFLYERCRACCPEEHGVER